MKKIYAVSCLMKSITIDNQIVKVEEGKYIIPAFDDYEKAFEDFEFKTIQDKLKK